MSTTRDGETTDLSLSALTRAPRSVQTGSPLRKAAPLFSLALASLLVLSACSDSDSDGDNASETEEAAAEGDDGDENSADDADGEAASDNDEEQSEEDDRFAVAELSDAAGNDLGSVEFLEAEGGVDVVVDLTDLNAGFRGVGIHEVGECEPQSSDDSDAVGDFLSAGDHIEGDVDDDDDGVVEGEDELEEEEPDVPDQPEGELPETQPEAGEGTHPQHAGDLPNLLVTEDGTAKSTVTTDRLSSDLLLDDDGSAFIVYADPDNHGNVPERYAPYGVDEETLTSGDAGERMACGVIEDA